MLASYRLLEADRKKIQVNARMIIFSQTQYLTGNHIFLKDLTDDHI